MRPTEPESLTRFRARWTTRWTDSLRDGSRIDWATPSAKRILRGLLLALSRGKCAFCEGILRLTSSDEIEHYHAKTVRPELVFDWPNLFPACGICNRSKGDLDHQGRLLKPDTENPELLLWLNPDTGELQPHPALDAEPEQARRVKETIEAYGLQRGALCAQRIEMMDEVNRWLRRIDNQADISQECREEWEKLIHPSRTLKFVIRHVLTLGGQPQLAEIDRQRFRGQV